ncbi:MAG: LysR family transcriptional regulator [Pseudomonadota bacterium]
MEVRQFRLFVLLAEELHFNRAARRAGVTQSVLSTQIRRLEDELGAELFSRTTRSVSLTPVGRDFLVEARAVLDRIDQAARVARSLATGKRQILRIGLTTVSMLSDAPVWIGRFHDRHPEIDLQLREIGTVDQESALATRDIDIGFLHPPLDHPDIGVRALPPSRFVALKRVDGGSSGHLPINPVCWRDLLEEPIVFFGRRRAPRLHDSFIASAQAVGVSPQIVSEARSFLSAVASAAAGVGVALVPEELAHRTPRGVTAVDILDCPIELQNGMAFANTLDTSAAQKFLDEFQE